MPATSSRPRGIVPSASVVSRLAVRPPTKAHDGSGAEPEQRGHGDDRRENEIGSHITHGQQRGEAGVDEASGESEKRADEVDRMGFPGWISSLQRSEDKYRPKRPSPNPSPEHASGCFT